VQLSLEEVERIARLARLRFSAAELETLTHQLQQVVAYVEQLADVPTDGVEPMAHAADVVGVFREDEPEPSLARDEALAQAPQSDGECFLVPAVLGW